MKTIGCDLHSRYQVMAMVKTDTSDVDAPGCDMRTEKQRRFTGPAQAIADRA